MVVVAEADPTAVVGADFMVAAEVAPYMEAVAARHTPPVVDRTEGRAADMVPAACRDMEAARAAWAEAERAAWAEAERERLRQRERDSALRQQAAVQRAWAEAAALRMGGGTPLEAATAWRRIRREIPDARRRQPLREQVRWVDAARVARRRQRAPAEMPRAVRWLETQA
jgi:hypothetical protein